MSKVYNRHTDNVPPDAVYIGRGTKWGNPYSISKTDTRGIVIKKFEKLIKSQPEFIAEIKKELKGKDLVCSCKPLPCHGDILLKIANEE